MRVRLGAYTQTDESGWVRTVQNMLTALIAFIQHEFLGGVSDGIRLKFLQRKGKGFYHDKKYGF